MITNVTARPEPEARVYRHFILHERFYLIGAWYESNPADAPTADLLNKLMEVNPDDFVPVVRYQILIMMGDYDPITLSSPEVTSQDTDMEREVWVQAGATCRRLMAAEKEADSEVEL